MDLQTDRFRPNETLRTGVSFVSLSVLSRPSKLVYEYSKNSSLIIDIDKEEGSAGYPLTAVGNGAEESSGPAPHRYQAISRLLSPGLPR